MRFLLIIFLSAIPIIGQAGQYRISGSVLVNKAGILHIFLVDEEQFSIPFTGIEDLTVTLKESQEQEVPFCFSGIPEGQYGIRVYIDTNGNGKLDRGFLGPSEPWGMSWIDEPKKGIPRFRDIAFYVDRDMQNILVDTRYKK
jgi:uncharacterized protein (DUF2141 family)